MRKMQNILMKMIIGILCHHYRNSKKNYFLLLNRKSKRWKICIQQIVEEMLLVMVHLLD